MLGKFLRFQYRRQHGARRQALEQPTLHQIGRLHANHGIDIQRRRQTAAHDVDVQQRLAQHRELDRRLDAVRAG